MAMRFDPKQPFIQLCLQGIRLEEIGDSEGAKLIYDQAFEEASCAFEQFLATYFIGRQFDEANERVLWLKQSVEFALQSDDQSALTALPKLYSMLASACEALNQDDLAKDYAEKSALSQSIQVDTAPFFHGTRAMLNIGDQLIPGMNSNYKEALQMNHIYFTANVNGAGLAAALAKGEGPERVYVVVPTGDYESDPNVTDQKFPGNLTRSYRSSSPLTIVGIIEDWQKQTVEDVAAWRQKLENHKGEIIN